jgi:hypothetical protein
VGGTPRPFSESFIHTGEEGVEVQNLTELPRCSFTTIEPSQVNANNYALILTNIESYLRQLQYVLIDSAGDGLGVNGSLDAVVQNVEWQKCVEDFEWHVADSCNEYKPELYDAFDAAPFAQGSSIKLLAATWGKTNQCSFPPSTEWWLALLDAPGGMGANLEAPRYMGGTGRVFIKVDGLVSGKLKWRSTGSRVGDFGAFLGSEAN